MYKGKRWIPSLTESILLGKKGDRQEINLELWKISDTARGGGERITELWAGGLSLHQNQLCFQSSQEDLVSLVGTGAKKTISRAC